MKKIMTNALQSYITSAMGAIAGIPEMITGYNQHDVGTFVKGVALFLLGLVAKEN